MFFLAIFAPFGRKMGNPDFLILIVLISCHVSYSFFRIAQSLFFWELILCMLCYSYTGIRIDGIVPKERAQNAPRCLLVTSFSRNSEKANSPKRRRPKIRPNSGPVPHADIVWLSRIHLQRIVLLTHARIGNHFYEETRVLLIMSILIK